ncbi:MAG: glycosyltransferase [Actinomycetaceae bacterium]|nr:glycosyltransferase [Actinomycetaceae bacterium]
MKFLIFGLILLLGFTLSIVARYKEGYRKPLIVAYIAIAIAYVAWRITHTIPTEGAWNIGFGIAFLILEIVAILQTIGFGILFWKPAAHRRGPAIDSDSAPSVDVYIATYNEPVDILEATIVAATQLDYPADRYQIYVCDDGDRPHIRDLATKWNVGYIRRDDHVGAKAGNLNNAMTQTDGEFIVTMDADMVLKPKFLRHTVGHFQDESVAFVQVPQAFHNEDVFQNNLFGEHTMRNDQDFFMRFIEPQRDLHNAAIYIGSGAIFRRSALDEIGGFVTDVITEDMATGLVLQNAGWKAVYVNEVLATGLAAETYADLLKQRIRWARGNIQVAKKYGATKLRNLNLTQKWLLYDSVHFWFFGVYRLAFLFLPMLVLATGVQLLRGALVNFLLLWSAQFLFSRFVYDAVTKGRFKTVWTSVYEFAQAPQISMAVLQELFFGNNIGFQVTDKGRETGKARFAWEKAWPQVILFVLSIVTISYCAVQIYRVGWVFFLPVAIPLAWLVYNTICLVGALASAVDQPRYRHRLANYQASGHLHLSGAQWPVQVEALHTEKICFSLPASRFKQADLNGEATIVFGDFDPISLTFEYAEIAEGTAFVFAYYQDLSKENYSRLVTLLNHVNTLRFQNRPNPHRIGMWDATIGLFVRALTRPDRIMGRSRRELVEIAVR